MLASKISTSVGKRVMPFTSSRTAPTVRHVVRAGPDMNDPKVQAAMQEAMKDPNFMERMKAMQEQMQRPEVQQQMQQMQQFMANQQVQERLKAMKDDPEFAEMFEDIKKNGMGVLMKYMNDERVLNAFSRKLGDVIPAGAAAAGAAPAAAARPAAGAPEINNILDAARFGDLEAVEDYIAIGKDVNMADSEKRTPLHVAAAYAHAEIAKVLIESGAQLEATDSKQNTPLHYAAGYGRPELVSILLDAGASTAAKNSTGKTAAELVKSAPPNPINTMPEIMARLEK